MISVEYAAGFFDGEGCINFSSDRYGKPFIRILVVNTDVSVLELFKDRWQGNITANKRHKDNWKQSYTWRLSHAKAYDFIREIQPFLVVKKRQSQFALDFSQLTPSKGNRWTEESLQEATKLIDALRKANKKGVEAL